MPPKSAPPRRSLSQLSGTMRWKVAGACACGQARLFQPHADAVINSPVCSTVIRCFWQCFAARDGSNLGFRVSGCACAGAAGAGAARARLLPPAGHQGQRPLPGRHRARAAPGRARARSRACSQRGRRGIGHRGGGAGRRRRACGDDGDGDGRGRGGDPPCGGRASVCMTCGGDAVMRGATGCSRANVQTLV